MQKYQPGQYQVEAFNWLMKVAKLDSHPKAKEAEVLVNGILHLEETFDFIIAEAGPNWQHCEFTRSALTKINTELELAYRKVNTIWADGYRSAFGKDNT